MKPNVPKILSSRSDKSLNNGDETALKRLKMKMWLKCKSCGKVFNSTYTSEEFATIPKEQYEAGTLHLCPHCGSLSTYLLKDYFEST